MRQKTPEEKTTVGQGVWEHWRPIHAIPLLINPSVSTMSGLMDVVLEIVILWHGGQMLYVHANPR